MRKFLKRVVAAATSVATVGAMLLPVAPVHAASFSSSSDTMTRLKISTTSDHTVRMTLPVSYTFDGSSTTSDAIVFNFPDTFTTSASGTFVTGDFSFNDGTARTVTTVATPGTNGFDVSCADGANNVGVVVDTDASAFKVKACGASYTSSTATSTITFRIFGTAANGTLTNPSSAGSATLSATMTDMGAASAHVATMGLSIMDDDQVTVTASVDPALTFDIDIQSSCGSESAAPYTVALGTLTTTSVTTASSHICLDLDSNASQGVFVTVQGSGSADALESAGSGGTIGTTYSGGGQTLLTPGTVGYGICVSSTSVVTGSATAVSPYNGNCTGTTAGGGNIIGGVDSAAPQNILTTSGAAIDGTANNTADIVVKAAVSGTTLAGNDYTDVLTFIATGTF